jgi:hypothetical protein
MTTVTAPADAEGTGVGITLTVPGDRPRSPVPDRWAARRQAPLGVPFRTMSCRQGVFADACNGA